MPFLNNGETHASGIKNECDIVNYMITHPENLITKELEKTHNSSITEWVHEGGTKQKKDASFKLTSGEIFGISIKNHDGKTKSGSFDWENTTCGVPEELKNKIIEFKKKYSNTPVNSILRSELADIFSLYLDNLSSDSVSVLLDKIYQAEPDTKYIIINHKKLNELILVNKSNLDEYFNATHKHHYILKSTPKAKTSRQIWIKTPDGNEINTNLRVRLLLNNGITALLGQSEKNKSASPCLKIQQDNILGFIAKCIGKIIIKY